MSSDDISRWQIELRGESIDLTHLSRTFSTAPVRVVLDREHYFLESRQIDLSLEPAQALQKGAELLTLLNGICRSQRSNWRSVEAVAVQRVGPDGRVMNYILLARIEARAHMSATLTVTKSDGTARESPKVPTTEEKLLQAALASDSLQRVLRLFAAKPQDWVNLVRIIEAVRADVGGAIHDFGWVTKAEIALLERTANSVKAVGDQARHGVERSDPPKRPMLFATAEVVVRRLVEAYAQHKGGSA